MLKLGISTCFQWIFQLQSEIYNEKMMFFVIKAAHKYWCGLSCHYYKLISIIDDQLLSSDYQLWWWSTIVMQFCSMILIVQRWSDLHRWWAPFVLWAPAMLFPRLSDPHLKVTTPWLSGWSFSDDFLIQIEINVAVEDDAIFQERKKREFIIGGILFESVAAKISQRSATVVVFRAVSCKFPKLFPPNGGICPKILRRDCGNFLYGFFTGAKLIFFPGGRRLIALLFALKWSLNSI